MSTSTIYRILTDAADLIERQGWTQGEYGSKDGCFCLFGAFHESGRADLGEQYEEAWALLEQALEGGNPITWNDEAGRTKEEVLNLLRDTAGALK